MILQKLRIPQTESLRVWLLGEEAVEVAATGEAIPSPSFFLRNLSAPFRLLCFWHLQSRVTPPLGRFASESPVAL
jgi:hypothetical protein